ncbi:MAG TPA: ABC transporter ATP-binding protein [Acidimicrobiales bacterium]|nr:ABC transporter ATP-binding protein [Acidimicrobiales bacterium]
MSSVETAARDVAPTAETDRPVIYARGLTKVYAGGNSALAGLDLEVGRGEVFGFLGPNGAGKTTAVKLLVGLCRPSAGEAMVLGAPIGDVEVRRRIGYLPEMFRYQPWLSAVEVLAYHCDLLRLPRAGRDERIGRLLARVGLSERSKDRVARFSKGMQQRLGLAVALVAEPELVFLDEPTSALDPVGRHEVREVIRGLRSEGVSVFLNTHLLDEAQQVCDRVAVIDHGRTLAIGPLAELLSGKHRLRVSVSGLEERDWIALERFGPWARDQGWAETSGVGEEEVPELVAAMVSAGGRVHAVVPTTLNLEERFLEILGEAR